jgi:ATP-dependent helicase HrpB
LREARSVVVVAEPGAGKTTRVPPAILAATGLLTREHPHLVMLQPRRVAARAAAQRIADENKWTLGREVGYHIRFERKITAQTRLRVLTEGILARQLLEDPMLAGVGCVILDEFHERSIHTDLSIALLREIRGSIRPDLLIVVMSATLSAEPVAAFLGDCPVVRSSGRLFPIDIEYRASMDGALPHEHAARSVAEAVSRTDASGDVLVFLPGAFEIQRTQELLVSSASTHDLDLIPLHGSLPFERQMRALQPSGRRKVILSTNIAETSLTIDGVRTVIDSGLARVPQFDPQRGMDRLELVRISQASAEQRAGRAGRTAPGRCIRLWSAKEHHQLDEFEVPEIHRVDLCSALLILHAWGQPDPRRFDWFERPAVDAIESAERLLAMLGALDSEVNGRITDTGRRLTSLPVHPRIGRVMLEAADAGHANDGAMLAAILSEKDIAPDDLPPRIGESDLLVRMELLPRLQSPAVQQLLRVREDLLRNVAWTPRPRAGASAPACETPTQLVLRWTLLAYPDRVARRRANDPGRAVMVGGGGLRIARESVVKKAELFVAIDARHDARNPNRESLVRVASAIDPEWLPEFFPQSIHKRRQLEFEDDRQRVVARSTSWYRDLLLREDTDASVDPDLAGEVLADALALRARDVFGSDETAAAILARVAFLRRWLPEQPWPVYSDAELAAILRHACSGKRSLEEVRRASLAAALTSLLPYPLGRMLDEHAPQAIEVPSGSRIHLRYHDPARPTLAVRLQELFGWTDTPRLAQGRAPVVLQLLGPNFRPVQITDDLRSFWKSTYAQVRKDLRVRYPKHAWPENPLEGKPQAKGRRRRG